MNYKTNFVFAAILALVVPSVGLAEGRLNPGSEIENEMTNPTQSANQLINVEAVHGGSARGSNHHHMNESFGDPEKKRLAITLNIRSRI